jgi:simple sugar transport system substrate-binding protein
VDTIKLFRTIKRRAGAEVSVLSSAFAASLLLGAALSAAEAPAPKEPLRLVFITCAVDAKFFEPVKRGMQDAARMLNVRCEFIGTPGVDVKAQAEMVGQAVRDGVQGIALNIIDPVAFDEPVKEAIKAGVPVVAFNVDDHATPNVRLAAVNQRLYDAGRKLGGHLAPEISKGSHVLLTMHDKGVSALEDRARGIRDSLKARNLKWTQLVTATSPPTGRR